MAEPEHIKHILERVMNTLEKENTTLKQRFLEWLKPDGIVFFSGLIKKHGSVDAVWMEDDDFIPHIVHFREGMQVRNWMREQSEFKDKSNHWLDDNWAIFVTTALDIRKD